MPHEPVPAHVYSAAVGSYVIRSPDLFASDEVVRGWSEKRWPGVDVGKIEPWQLAHWVLSQAAQDGHE